MRVRPATDADREFIVGLCGRFAEFPLPPWRARAEVAQGTARRMIAALGSMSERSTVVIAQDDAGTPLGFAWMILIEDFYSGRDVAKLSEIAVERDGTGAGTALIKATEAWAASHGCDCVVLNVMQENARARAFYEHHGFAPEYTMMVKVLSDEKARHTPG